MFLRRLIATTRKSRLLLIAPILLSVAGCVLLSEQYRYGFVAFEGKDVYKTGTDVYIPPEAPSIVQRYQPFETGRSGTPIAKGHEGIDLVGKVGLPVIAPADGLVERSLRSPMYGNQLLINHGPDADGIIVKTRYYHLKKRHVKKGDAVLRGQQLGTLGATGALAPTPHLHFETQHYVKEGPFQKLNPANPHFYWWNGRGQVTCYDSRRDWQSDTLRLTYPAPCRGIPWQG